MKKIFSVIMFVQLLAGMVFLEFNIQPVKAYETINQTIYIKADGTVDPSTAPIQRSGDTYTLINNVSSTADTGIIIMKDNITLDGSGCEILGPTYMENYRSDSLAIYLSEVKNVTVKNLRVSQFGRSIVLRGKSVNNRIIENFLEKMSGIGVELDANASNNSLIGNTILVDDSRYTEDGIHCNSSSNYFSGNRIHVFSHYTGDGLYLGSNASFNIMAGNDFNVMGVYMHEADIHCDGVNNSITGNNITGNLWIHGANNSIYHNNIIPNHSPIEFVGGGSNVWDNGYPSGGNYWSSCVGVDKFSGPYQNETGSDGIFDAPFIINDIIDHYPFIMPWTSRSAPPVPKIFPPSQSITKLAGEPIIFNASLSLPGWNGTHIVPIAEYRWDFGDGNTTSTVDNTITHTYAFANTYSAKLTVFDSRGLNSSCPQTIIVNMPTSLFISTNPSSTTLGFTVGINGTLYDIYGKGLENEQILFYYLVPGGSYETITSGTTDSLGHYNIQWIPTATGYFTITASWPGNTTHLPTSKDVNLSVIPYQNQYIFSVESNSTISELVFNITSQKLSFNVNGPNGTFGYARVVIAKSIVPDMAKTKVFLDGTQCPYFYTSREDSWILTLTYDHSIHQIEMQFSSPSKFLGLDWWTWMVIIVGVAGVVIGAALIFRRRKP